MKRNIEKKNRKAFTLIEVLVALFIFSLAMVMVSSIFSGFFKTYRIVRVQQRSLEQASEAINIMAKTIRTSTVVYPDATDSVQEIQLFDHSQNSCIRYSYANGTLSVGSQPLPDSVACDSATVSTTNTLVENMGSGTNANFAVSLPGTNNAGKVTISFFVDIQDAAPITLQTSVSLRNGK